MVAADEEYLHLHRPPPRNDGSAVAAAVVMEDARLYCPTYQSNPPSEAAGTQVTSRVGKWSRVRPTARRGVRQDRGTFNAFDLPVNNKAATAGCVADAAGVCHQRKHVIRQPAANSAGALAPGL